jgi:hypothetical protein
MNKAIDWSGIIVGCLCLVAFVLLFLMLKGMLRLDSDAIRLPVLVITGVMALFATLALVALTFSVAGLADGTQALGLPEGSVRAAIALSLIVIFAITSIHLYSSMKDAGPNSPQVDFGKQVFAVVGTLMTSVASFYFASRAAATATKPAAATPKLTSITPTQASKAAGVPLSARIAGTDLQLTKNVNLELGAGKVPGTDVTSSAELIKCEFTLDPNLPVGKYDVVVTTSDGATATLPGAVEITA